MQAPAKLTGFATVIVNVPTKYLTPLIQLMAKLVELVRLSFYQTFNHSRINVLFIKHTAAKSELIKSKLPNNVLSKIWKLADVDQDGFLDLEEFALAMHLIKVKVEGNELPNILPDHLVPPSKR